MSASNSNSCLLVNANNLLNANTLVNVTTLVNVNTCRIQTRKRAGLSSGQHPWCEARGTPGEVECGERRGQKGEDAKKIGWLVALIAALDRVDGGLSSKLFIHRLSQY